MELSEHGIVLIVEESGCLQAKVYLQREVFLTDSEPSTTCNTTKLTEELLHLSKPNELSGLTEL